MKKSTESNFHETNDNLKDVTLLDNGENFQSSENGRLDEPDKSFLENDIDKTEAKLKYITQLESILAQRLHQNQTSDSTNTNSKSFEKSYKSDQHVSKSAKENGAKFLERILQQRLRLHHNETYYSENTMDSENFVESDESDQHLSDNAKAKGMKLLESILQHRLHLNESSDLEKSKEFQEKTKGKSQKDSQNLNSSNENGNGREALAKNANKDTDSKTTGFNMLNHDNEVSSDDGNKLKTLHQSQTETTEILDSPSSTSEVFHLPKNRDILKLDNDMVKPYFTNTNGVDTSEKPFQSNSQMDEIMESGSNAILALATQRKSGSRKKQEKNLADVDRFIQDELNKKKKVEGTGTTSLGLSDASHVQGKFALNADEVKDYANDNNIDIEDKNKVGGNIGYKNVNNNINNDSVSSNDTLNNNNTKNTYLDDRNNDYLNNNVIVDRVLSDNDTVLLNSQENILDKSPTDSTVDTEKQTNKTIDKQLTLTPTTLLINDNNKTKNNQNGNNDKYDSNNNNKLGPTHNTNSLDTTMKVPETIPTITQNPNPSPPNLAIHYDLRRPEIASMKNKSKAKPVLKIEPKMQNVSADKKHGGNQSVDIQGKIMPWKEFLTAQSDSHESDDSINESDDTKAGNATLDSSEVKVVDVSNIEPEEDEVVVETEKSAKQEDDVNVIHSGDPDLEISP